MSITVPKANFFLARNKSLSVLKQALAEDLVLISEQQK